MSSSCKNNNVNNENAENHAKEYTYEDFLKTFYDENGALPFNKALNNLMNKHKIKNKVVAKRMKCTEKNIRNYRKLSHKSVTFETAILFCVALKLPLHESLKLLATKNYTVFPLDNKNSFYYYQLLVKASNGEIETVVQANTYLYEKIGKTPL